MQRRIKLPITTPASMFRSLTRISLGRTGASPSFPHLRPFTYAAKHRVLPTTLYRTEMQLERRSGLYDLSQQQDGWADYEAVELSQDGLVRPNINPRGRQFALVKVLRLT